MLVLLLFWWVLLFSCKIIDGNYLFACPDHGDVHNWTVTVHCQEELEQAAASSTDKNTSRCIQLLLNTSGLRYGLSYRLNIVEMMKIRLGTLGGLIVTGAAGANRVHIDCIANISDEEDLKRLLSPLSNASFVKFDSLVFVKCPVPIMIQEVSLIVMRNCKFM